MPGQVKTNEARAAEDPDHSLVDVLRLILIPPDSNQNIELNSEYRNGEFSALNAKYSPLDGLYSYHASRPLLL